MRILVVGDVVGRVGRDVVAERLPEIRDRLKLDFVVVNGENAAHGFGLTRRIAESFYQNGADCITTGNHVWDQRELLTYIDEDPKLLRPINFPPGTPGRGAATFTTADGRKVMVLHPMCRLFMDPMEDPFRACREVVERTRLGRDVAAIVVDVHGEATSEKQALASTLDGAVSGVFGTHTHVPTADHRVMPGGTGFLSDIGMTGDYDSVIGMQKEPASARFVTKLPTQRLEPAEGAPTLCAVLLETDDATGLARRVSPLRVGGHLQEVWPA